MVGGANRAARWRTWKSITSCFAVTPATISEEKPDHAVCRLPWTDAIPEAAKAVPECRPPGFYFGAPEIFTEALTL